VAAALLLASPAVAWFLLNRDATRAALRDRAESALRARLPGARLGPSLRVDPRFRVVLGPLTIAARAEGAPVVTVERVRVRPRWRALLAGRTEAAIVWLDGVTVETGPRGEALRELADSLRGGTKASAGGAPRGATEPPVVRISDLRVRGLTLGEGVVEVGPVSGLARAVRDGDGRAVELRLRFPREATLDVKVRRDVGSISAAARLEGVTRDTIPDALLRLLPVQLVAGTLKGELDVSVLDREHGTVRWDLRAEDVAVASERLSPEAVGPFHALSRGDATVDLTRARLKVEEAEVHLGRNGGAAATVSLDLTLRSPRAFDLRVEAPAIEWSALAGALPAQLAAGTEAPAVSGTFGVELHAVGPVDDATRWALDASVDLSRLGHGTERLELEGPFRHAAQLSGGRTREIVVGPSNAAFVPLASLPQHVVRAITTAEDASFWGHDGFDFHELQDAIATGAQRGQLGRGASTISQQVAKNLWLGRERTLARKAREALLTIALEASLSKRRILEIYVNIAEWGPGIVGLGEAARHYFHKEAPDLSPREAAFLASIIPNPVRYHMYCARGELSPAWEMRVEELLFRLWTTGVLTSEELDAALVERLVFTHG
jgi:hypothetical protein